MSSSSSTQPRLRKHANGRWYAFTRRGGHDVGVSTGTKDRAEAEAKAPRVLRRKREEWGEEPAAVGGAPPVTPPPAPRAVRAPVAPEALRDKLRALGGAPPVSSAAAGEAPPAASVAPPSGVPDDQPEVLTPAQMEEVRSEEKKAKEEEGDDEANELFADMLAGAIVGGHQRAVKNFCVAQEPPKRAAEPNETMLEWERAGIQARLRKAMGKTGLSPNAKLVIGVIGVTISMVWNAEEIPASERRPPQPAPKQAPQAQAAQPTQQHTAPTEQRAPDRQALSLVPGPGEAAAGRFE